MCNLIGKIDFCWLELLWPVGEEGAGKGGKEGRGRGGEGGGAVGGEA